MGRAGLKINRSRTLFVFLLVGTITYLHYANQKGFFPYAYGTTVSYFENGQLESLTSFKNGKPDGTEMVYFKDGNIRIENNFKEGQLEGISKSYFRNGLVENDLVYKNGQLEGTAQFYSKDGQLIEQYSYSQGRRDGLAKFYYSSGGLKLIARFIDEKLNGKAKRFYENGALQAEFSIKEGKMEGEFTKYNRSGQILQTGLFHDGQPVQMSKMQADSIEALFGGISSDDPWLRNREFFRSRSVIFDESLKKNLNRFLGSKKDISNR